LFGSHAESLSTITPTPKQVPLSAKSKTEAKESPVVTGAEGEKGAEDAHDGSARQLSAPAEPGKVMDPKKKSLEVETTSADLPVEEPAKPENMNPGLETPPEKPGVVQDNRNLRRKKTYFRNEDPYADMPLTPEHLEDAKAELLQKQEQILALQKTLINDTKAFRNNEERVTRLVFEREKAIESLKKVLAQKEDVGEWLNKLVMKSEALFAQPLGTNEPTVNQLAQSWDKLLKVKNLQELERANLENMKADLKQEIKAFKKMKEQDPGLDSYVLSRSGLEQSYSKLTPLLTTVASEQFLDSLPGIELLSNILILELLLLDKCTCSSYICYAQAHNN